MLAAPFLIALLLVTVPFSPQQPKGQGPPNVLLQTAFGDDLSLVVNQSFLNISVSLYGKPSQPKLLTERRVEVWLLRQDGSSVKQLSRSVSDGISRPGLAPRPDFATFVFELTPSTELDGVVIRVDGKLFVRDIQR